MKFRDRLDCLLLATAFAVLFTGCATSPKYKMSPGSRPAIAYNIEASIPPLKGKLHTVIIYRADGSWKDKALWDEYAVTIYNTGKASLHLNVAELIDVQGASLHPGVDPWALERLSEENWKHYRDTGLILAMGSVGAYAIAGTVATVGLVGGSLSTMTVAAAALPAMVGANVTYVLLKNKKNKKEIDAEFHRRRLAFPAVIESGESLSGSLFFPQTPGPQQLVVHCQSDDGDHSLEFEFRDTPIGSIHLKQPESSD